jgi:hypothetical protein
MALRQSLNWQVAASAVAKKDLTPVFAGRWRMPVPDAMKNALKDVDWTKADLDSAEVIKSLPAEKTACLWQRPSRKVFPAARAARVGHIDVTSTDAPNRDPRCLGVSDVFRTGAG